MQTFVASAFAISSLKGNNVSVRVRISGSFHFNSVINLVGNSVFKCRYSVLKWALKHITTTNSRLGISNEFV